MPQRSQPAMEAFRLSPQQERLWSLHGDASVPFVAWTIVSLRGELDVDAFRGALRDVACRHEILRTNFDHLSEVGTPVQSIDPARLPDVEEHDLRNVARGERNGALHKLLWKTAFREFDLPSGSPFRVLLVRLAETEHRAMLTLPALCADWSGLSALVGELGDAYARRAGDPVAPRDALQYADVAQWQRELLEEADRPEPALAKRLALKLPWSGTTREGGSFVTGRLSLEVDEPVASRLRDLAGEDASLRSFLLTVWTVLLWRLAGRAPVCVGSLHHGRDLEELERTPGPLAKYLPLAPTLRASMSFRQAWREIGEHDARLAATQHPFSWDRVFDGSDPERNRYPACFDFGRFPAARSVGGVELEVLYQDACIDRSDVRLACRRRGERISTIFEYDAGRISRWDAERLGEQFDVLLRGAVDHPEGRIGGFDVLSRFERRRLVVDFNATRMDVGGDPCIHRVIERQAARHAGKVAVELETERCRYAELNGRANRLARHLRRRGVAEGSLVGICLERSVDMIVSILAVLKAGGAYVPLDPRYPRARIRLMIEEAGVGFVITKSSLLAELPASAVRTVALDREREAIEAGDDGDLGLEVSPESLAYVIYTSGSTGTPKGVMVTHRGLMLSNEARRERFAEPVGKFLLLSSFSFDSSVVGIFWTLSVGGTLFLVPEDAQKDPAELGEVVARNAISHLLTLPSFYALLLEGARPRRLESLRTAIVAGEPCHARVIERHRRLLPEVGLFSEYGATETTVFSSVCDCLASTLSVAPLGEPIANAAMFVLDPDFGPVPIGVAGEVYFGGEAISPGYVNRPGLTAARFVPDPFSGRHGARLYRSGDLARHHPDGGLEFLGRTDNQVKIRGFRIELEEIEVALSAHPGIEEAVVLALDPAAWRGDDGSSTRRDPSADAGGLRLAAYVVGPAAGGPRELREFLARKLPEHMIPAELVPLDAMPRTPNGKVDRDALPAPGAAREDSDASFVAPGTDTEKLLARIWTEVLGLDRVGVHDNFFEVGGDSILSIQIVSRVAREGLALTPLQIFQHQTIAALAGAVRTSRRPAAEQHEITGPVPRTPIQHWFCDLEVPDRSHWNMPLLLEMQRPVPRGHLQAAADELSRHHDALRLRLVRTDAGWDQRIEAFREPIPVEHEDLAATSGDSQWAELERRAAAYQASLDLERGPLMRLVLFERGRDLPPLLLWVLHHLAGDIVSWRILLEDLQTALDQLRQGEVIRLPAKTTSFKRWAERLRELAARPEIGAELEFWRRQIDGDAGAMPLDLAGGRERNTERSMDIVRAALDAADTNTLLHEIAPAYRCQINEVLLTALGRTLAAWKGESRVAIEVEAHGREEGRVDDVDLSRTVGWFTTSYPMSLTVREGDGLASALQSIKRQLRDVPGRGFSYSLLRYLGPDAEGPRELRAARRPDVNFNYLGQFGQAVKPSSLFRLAPPGVSIGSDRDPDAQRTCLLDVVGWVIDDRLQMEWYYSRNAHRRETIERLARDFNATLRELIAGVRKGDGLPQLPAGVDEFGWDDDKLQDIAAAIERARSRPRVGAR